MSLRRKQLKRLRYYRASVPEQDRMAKACGLILFKKRTREGQRDCDSPGCPHKGGLRFWYKWCGGEIQEMDDAVCSHCLRHYYLAEQAQLYIYTDRNCRRWERQERKFWKSNGL
jgi:hypothetical protein